MLGIADRAHPCSSKLIGEYQIERIVGPRELIFFLGKTGVGHRLSVVDEETDAIGIHLNSIYVPVADFDICRHIVRGNVLFLKMERVMRVYCLIGFLIRVEMLHDINLSIIGCFHFRIGHQPDSWPKAVHVSLAVWQRFVK